MPVGNAPSLNGPKVDRFHELVDLVAGCDADEDLVMELHDIVGDIVSDTQEEAIQHQGDVIMAAIRGDLTAWPGCTPAWFQRPQCRSEVSA